MTCSRSIESFKATLSSEGADAALAFLNAGVPHRFSAVYRLDGRTLKNVLLYDKANEITPAYLVEVPFETSFCQFVIRDGHFQTDDSALDHRLDAPPYQGLMVSYHGVPILSGGEIWGTLCHFDVVAQPLSDDEFDLLQGAGAIPPGFVAER
jgi:GAF domain-containing protein